MTRQHTVCGITALALLLGTVSLHAQRTRVGRDTVTRVLARSSVGASRLQHVIKGVATAPASGSLNQIVERSVMPQVTQLFDKLVREQRDITIDGVAAFTGKDKFLPGKIAIGLSHVLVHTPRNDPKFAIYLAGFRQLADLTVGDDNETWGIYYYLSALNRLRKAQLLSQAVSSATLAKLQHKLDWRGFVAQPEFTLINLPTNYYGVAFSIARLRYLMGWEDKSGSEALLQKMVSHYQTYSGTYGFSDETDGEGRFDRYSILLIGEICQRFIETGMPVTPQLKQWLRNSVNVLLPRLNAQGQGFEFGRSIGPYGETAYLEVLAAAATLDVLTPTEKAMAYAFATRATTRYVNFWYDSSMQSVNLWEKGRRTDAYRAKYRILGENLSLTHQLLYTNDEWNRMGFQDRAPSSGFDAWLAQRPRFTTTWFARGAYDRALLTFRDSRGRIFSLPMVNGGASQHNNSPYFPIPYSHDVVQGVADVSFPQLIPQFTLADSSVLIPAAWFRDIATVRRGGSMTVTYGQREMDRLGSKAPIKDARLSVRTTYVITDGVITRTDVFTPTAPLVVTQIRMEFASFSDNAEFTGNAVRFANGVVSEFAVTGLDRCIVQPVDGNEEFRTPTGQLKSHVVCASKRVVMDTPLTISWRMRYR